MKKKKFRQQFGKGKSQINYFLKQKSHRAITEIVAPKNKRKQRKIFCRREKPMAGKNLGLKKKQENKGCSSRRVRLN